MATKQGPAHRSTSGRHGRIAGIASLGAAALFVGAAALQLLAAIQRWVIFQPANGISVEDHLFDYSVPYEPWVPIGTAAQLYGVGMLLVALGVLLLPVSATLLRRPTEKRATAAVRMSGEFALAVIGACSLGVEGAHALVSGINGTPSFLQHWGALGWLSLLSLIALAVLWRTNRALMLACVFLIGSTSVGYLVSTFFIAPLISGGSHDTARWTEAVVAGWAAAAGAAMVVAVTAHSRRA
ncbi:hypothetical protein ACLRGF_07410 [Mycetocola zhadangensis]|uniref:hypothetical protein n=1 Tax=Mycetocola zhadangensis TaxID=1164595 RepID=UPI003A4D51D6